MSDTLSTAERADHAERMASEWHSVYLETAAALREAYAAHDREQDRIVAVLRDVLDDATFERVAEALAKAESEAA
jgi:hypothetical protein